MTSYVAQMATFIALLRAVNVGGTGKLAMADLRSIAKEVGLSDVRTYIQSGNLIFSSDDAVGARAALEKRLEDYAGKAVGVVLRTAEEMRGVWDANPFPNAEPSKVGVVFLNDTPPPDTMQTAKGQADEEIAVGAREVYIHFPSGMGRSKLRLHVMSEGTMRNVNTIGKLAKMATEI